MEEFVVDGAFQGGDALVRRVMRRHHFAQRLADAGHGISIAECAAEVGRRQPGQP